MKNRNKKISSVLGLLAALALPAFAGGFNLSLGTTNVLTSANTNITSWPTNQASSGTNTLTGRAADITDCKEFGLQFQGYVSNGTSATIGVTLVTSYAPGNPVVDTTGTNRNDFQTTGFSFSFTLPAMTNWFNWQTNFNSTSQQAQGNFIGIYTITNNLAASQFITNTNGSLFYIEKKHIPTPLIAQ